MATFLNSIGRWFGFGGNALSDVQGVQYSVPSTALVEGSASVGVDAALQISAVWAAVERRANTVASLPMFVYRQKNGEKVLARDSSLYTLLHDSPNSRMTSFEFWRALIMALDLKGNAYARIERNSRGDAIALWPLSSDQMRQVILPDTSVVYEYASQNSTIVYNSNSILHLKGLGNGSVGLSRLDYMRGTLSEQSSAQNNSYKMFANSGKPHGILTVDQTLKPDQREALRKSYGELSSGNSSRIAILEAQMKYTPLGLSAADRELLSTRQFGVEEIARFFDIPPVMIHHANVTSWGSGISAIVDGWSKLSLRPLLVMIEQAITKMVLSSKQRADGYTVEFSQDAILRGNPTERAEQYSRLLQNGVINVAEVRQLENLPFIEGTDVLHAQSNLVPLNMLGKVKPANTQTAITE